MNRKILCRTELDILEASQAVRYFLNALVSCFGGKRKKYGDWFGKYGGAFCMMDGKTGLIILHTIIGFVPPEKIGKYLSLSFEKATRLFVNPDHLTSEESKDEALKRYGGAVRGRRYIYAFSGFPATGDSLLSLRVAKQVERIGKRLEARIERRAKIRQLSSTFRFLEGHVA